MIKFDRELRELGRFSLATFNVKSYGATWNIHQPLTWHISVGKKTPTVEIPVAIGSIKPVQISQLIKKQKKNLIQLYLRAIFSPYCSGLFHLLTWSLTRTDQRVTAYSQVISLHLLVAAKLMGTVFVIANDLTMTVLIDQLQIDWNMDK